MKSFGWEEVNLIYQDSDSLRRFARIFEHTGEVALSGEVRRRKRRKRRRRRRRRRMVMMMMRRSRMVVVMMVMMTDDDDDDEEEEEEEEEKEEEEEETHTHLFVKLERLFHYFFFVCVCVT